MTDLAIENIEYKAKSKWSEMLLDEAVSLYKVVDKCPDKIKAFYELNTVDPKNLSKEKRKEHYKKIKELADSLTDKEKIKIHPKYYGKVLKQITNIPERIMSKIIWQEREELYVLLAERLVVGLLCFPGDIKLGELTSFKFDVGHTKPYIQEFWLPEYDQVVDEKRPMALSTAIEFTESADLQIFSKGLAGGKYERAANIVSILCRPKMKAKEAIELAKKHDIEYTPKGDIVVEPYIEEICLERAKKFKKLPMNIVWEVFFCLIQHSILCAQNIQVSLLEEQVKQTFLQRHMS